VTNTLLRLLAGVNLCLIIWLWWVLVYPTSLQIRALYLYRLLK